MNADLFHADSRQPQMKKRTLFIFAPLASLREALGYFYKTLTTARCGSGTLKEND